MPDTRKNLEMVAALLHEQSTVSLATTGENGEPCLAPVFYIADEALNLHWLSSESSLHSQNLSRRAEAAAAIYRPTEDWKHICGVQLRGDVSTLTDPDRRDAIIREYCERFEIGAILRPAIRWSSLYCLRPRFFRYIDNARGFGYKFELAREAEGWSLARSSE